MLSFPEDYFEAKVIDDFYVRPMIRRSWAAQMEVLAVVDEICKRHNIKYYAEFGTLLGAIRHQGFIPWDDDLDIGMLRDDYNRFYYYAKRELPKDLHLVDAYEHNGFKQLLTRVVNSFQVNPSREFMDKYHGCPYCVGIDIFVTDYLPRDKAEEQTYFDLLHGVGGLASTWDEMDKQDSRWEVLTQIEELTGVTINREDNVQNQLFQLTDQISRMYGPEDADEVGIAVLVADRENFRFPKSYYEKTIDLPFENISIPVPIEYEKIVRGRYGENYMIPVKRWVTHSYPFFKAQEEKLVKRLEEEGIDAFRYLDIMPLDKRERTYGIQYHNSMSKLVLENSEFNGIELKITGLVDYKNLSIDKQVEGIWITAEMMIQLGLKDVVELAQALQAKYITIDTREFMEHEKLDEILTSENEILRWTEIYIYIENGYDRDGRGRIVRSMYSDVGWLNETVDAYNMLCGRDCFGIALNVGYANVLNMNLRTFIEVVGERLFLVHINDNDGKEDQQQLPFTFTRGRGARTTDLYRLIGTLVRKEYRGHIVFDTEGLWENAPSIMQPSLIKLLWALRTEWEKQFRIKERLGQDNKKIILFGTGGMAYNYMCNWASDYPPYFMVDNNKDHWEKEFHGVPIKSPESILDIPEEERNVFICNAYYAQIGSQLEQMGIMYDIYNDNYYM